MTTPISNDNFSALQGLNRRNSDTLGDRHHASEQVRDPASRPVAEQTDIDRAQRRLAQETTGSGAPAIASADEARRRANLTLKMMNDSPVSALKAHAAVDKDAVEAAIRRPAV